MSFDGSGSAPAAGAVLLFWTLSFGDGTPDVFNDGLPPGAIPHTYSSPGTYVAKLTVTQDNQLAASAIAIVTARTGPTTTTTTIPAPPATAPHTTTVRPVPATTGSRPRAARVTPPTNRRVPPAIIGAPATTAAIPSATTVTQNTTTAPSSTTTAPPSTTATTVTAAPAPPPTPLTALAFSGRPSGPAGTGINVRASGLLPSCRTAYFYFDNTRIGAALVHGGRAAVGGLSAPGDATPGDHRVTSSCRPSGRPELQSTLFRISPSRAHRTAFVTSLNQPRQLSLTLKSIGFSAALTGLLVLLLGFPSQVFNSTLQENYEEVRAWFGLRRPLSDVVQDIDQRALFPVFLAASGALFALLTPDFGWNLSTLALAVGMAVAVAVTTIGFALPTFAYFGVRFRERGKVLVMPGTVLLGAGFVLISRLAHFQPGYLYGLLAVFVFQREVDKPTEGRLTAVAAGTVMVLALVAWVGRVPLSGATMGSGVGFWMVVFESALCGVFIIGLESTLVGLLPMRFLDGARIKEWNTAAWGTLFMFALFMLIEVLIQPGSGYVGHSSTTTQLAVILLYVGFAGFSFGFWGYFRYRRPRAVPGLAGDGELEVR